VRWLGAVQAQDYLGSLWAIGLRMQNATEEAVEQAIADRTIIRTWPMRGTLHFVAATDVRWMLTLLTPRVVANCRWRLEQLELDPGVFARGRKAFMSALRAAGTYREMQCTRHSRRQGLRPPPGAACIS